MDIINFIESNYGLSVKILSGILGKTEASLRKELTADSDVSKDLISDLMKPSKIIRIIENSDFIKVQSKKDRIIDKIRKYELNEMQNIINGSVFIKQVKRNELGYRKDDKIAAGSFVLIPKSCINMFPLIDNQDGEYCPHDFINVKYYAFNNRDIKNKGIQQLTYTYQNGKIVRSLRGEDSVKDKHDEYRLYNVSSGINIMPEDIMLMIQKKHNVFDYEFSLLHKGEGDYDKILELVNQNKKGSANACMIPVYNMIKGNIHIPGISWTDYVNYDEDEEPIVFDSIDEMPLDTKVVRDEDTDRLLSNALQCDDIQYIHKKIKAVVRDKSFRNSVLTQYDYTCAITGHRMVYNEFACLQGCHIIPRSHKGGDNPKNGICLDYNMHWLFDEGFFTIDANTYLVKVHDLILDKKEFDYLLRYNGKPIILPKDQMLWPDKSALEYHNKNIFGKFSRL